MDDIGQRLQLPDLARADLSRDLPGGCWGHEVDEVYGGDGGKAARSEEGATVHRGRAPARRCCATSAQDAAFMDLNRHLRPAGGALSVSGRAFSVCPNTIPHARVRTPPVCRTSSKRSAKSFEQVAVPFSIFSMSEPLTCTFTPNSACVRGLRFLRQVRSS